MKLKEILQESYYDGLYHISPNPNLTIDKMDNIAIKNYIPDKPYGGLWLAKGLSWIRWGIKENFIENIENLHLYRVKIDPKAKIMDMTETSTDIFLEPKGRKNQKFKKNDVLGGVDFEKVKKEYDGVRAYNFGGSTYDVPSVVIFNKNVIQSIEYVNSLIDVIRKM